MVPVGLTLTLTLALVVFVFVVPFVTLYSRPCDGFALIVDGNFQMLAMTKTSTFNSAHAMAFFLLKGILLQKELKDPFVSKRPTNPPC